MPQTNALKVSFVLCCILGIMNANARDSRIFQKDEIGNIQYNKPSAVIQTDGRIIETNTIGYKQYHKQQYIIKDGNIYQTDSIGNIQYHKPHSVIKK